MSEMGKAMMGTGEAEGEGRAISAAEAAISNPLLDNCSMKGAKGVLINITGGPDMTLFEVDEAANRIRDEVDPNANIIFGSTFNPDLEGRIRVSVVATGIDTPDQEHKTSINKYTVNFNDDKYKEIVKPVENLYKKPETDHSYGFMGGNHQETLELDESNHDEDDLDNNYEVDSDNQAYDLHPSFEEEVRLNKTHASGNVTEKREQIRKPISLLDRMAYSVGLKSYPDAEKKNNSSENDPRYQEEKVLSEVGVGGSYEEDTLDVPAFLRRRK